MQRRGLRIGRIYTDIVERTPGRRRYLRLIEASSWHDEQAFHPVVKFAADAGIQDDGSPGSRFGSRDRHLWLRVVGFLDASPRIERNGVEKLLCRGRNRTWGWHNPDTARRLGVSYINHFLRSPRLAPHGRYRILKRSTPPERIGRASPIHSCEGGLIRYMPFPHSDQAEDESVSKTHYLVD